MGFSSVIIISRRLPITEVEPPSTMTAQREFFVKPFGAQKRSLPVKSISGCKGSCIHPLFRKRSMIGCIELFEITVIIRLFFTGFECEEETVGMLPADIGNTVPE
jgi:hypothetical protein